MQRRSQPPGKTSSFRRELQSALVEVLFAYRAAYARFERHRRRAGRDRRSELLFDQVSLSKSLLFALADELAAEQRTTHGPTLRAA